MNRGWRLGLGAAAGLVGLLGSVRLVATAFASPLAWLPVLLVMLGWCAITARTAELRRTGPRAAATVVGLVLVGAVGGWFGTGGPVLALVCSLAGYLVLRRGPLLVAAAADRRPLRWRRDD